MLHTCGPFVNQSSTIICLIIYYYCVWYSGQTSYTRVSCVSPPPPPPQPPSRYILLYLRPEKVCCCSSPPPNHVERVFSDSDTWWDAFPAALKRSWQRFVPKYIWGVGGVWQKTDGVKRPRSLYTARFRYERRANRRDFFVSRLLVSTSHHYKYRRIVCDIVIVITIIIIMRGGVTSADEKTSSSAGPRRQCRLTRAGLIYASTRKRHHTLLVISIFSTPVIIIIYIYTRAGTQYFETFKRLFRVNPPHYNMCVRVYNTSIARRDDLRVVKSMR